VNESGDPNYDSATAFPIAIDSLTNPRKWGDRASSTAVTKAWTPMKMSTLLEHIASDRRYL
jgi:hypothetical protein